MPRALFTKLLISCALGALGAFLVARGGVPIIPPPDAFNTIKPWAIPAYLALVLLMHFMRAVRWRHLIHPVQPMDIKDTLVIGWIGFLAIFALPLRLGELARPTVAKVRYGISASTALGTVAVERVVDGLITAGCLAWTLAVLPRNSLSDPIAKHIPTYGWISVIGFLCASVLLVIFVWQRQLAGRWVHALLNWISADFAETVTDRLDRLAKGISTIQSPKAFIGFLSESLIYWALNALGMWVLALGVGLGINLMQAISLMSILAIGILLPAGPGLFGSFQLSVSKGLLLYLSLQQVSRQGATYIFLLYVCQAVVLVITGIVPLYAKGMRWRMLWGRTSVTP